MFKNFKIEAQRSFMALFLLCCSFLLAQFSCMGWAINDSEEACQRQLLQGISQEEGAVLIDAFSRATQDFRLFYTNPERIIDHLPSRFREEAPDLLRDIQSRSGMVSTFSSSAIDLLFKLIRKYGISQQEGNLNLLRAVIRAIKKNPAAMNFFNRTDIVLVLLDPTGRTIVPQLVSWTRRRWLGLRAPDRFLAPRAKEVLLNLGRLSAEVPNLVSNEFVATMANEFNRIPFEPTQGQDVSQDRFDLYRNLTRALNQRQCPTPEGLSWNGNIPIDIPNLVQDALSHDQRQSFRVLLTPNGEEAQLHRVGLNHPLARWSLQVSGSVSRPRNWDYRALGPEGQALMTFHLDGNHGYVSGQSFDVLSRDGRVVIQGREVQGEDHRQHQTITATEVVSEGTVRADLINDLQWFIENSPVKSDLEASIRALTLLNQGARLPESIIRRVAEVSKGFSFSSRVMESFLASVHPDQIDLLIELLSQNKMNSQYSSSISDRGELAREPLMRALGSNSSQVRSTAYEIYFTHHQSVSPEADFLAEATNYYQRESDENGRVSLVRSVSNSQSYGSNRETILQFLNVALMSESSQQVVDHIVEAIKRCSNQNRYLVYIQILRSLESKPEIQLHFIRNIQAEIVFEVSSEHLSFIRALLRSKHRNTFRIGVDTFIHFIETASRVGVESDELSRILTEIVNDPAISEERRISIRNRFRGDR